MNHLVDEAEVRVSVVKYFPNLDATAPGTQFQVYREYKPARDEIEITVLWREPGKERMRLDAVIDIEDFGKDDLGPKDFKILFVAPAEKVSRLWD